MSGVAVANSVTLVGSPWQSPLQVQLVWTPTRRDLVAPSQMKREINEFYGTTTNLPVSIVAAAIHSLMKAKRATQDPLDQYRNLVLRLVLRRIVNWTAHPLAFGHRPGLEWIQNRGRSMRPACFMDATKWLAGNEALVQETEKFYSHAANVLLPPMADIVYSPMKRNGASARDQYRNQQLKEVKQ